MTRQTLALTLLLVGLVLLGVGLGWTRMVPPSVYWGEDQAREYSAAQADLHAKSHLHDHSGKPEAEFVTARTRYEDISRQLESAQSSRNRTGTLVLAAGILAILSGIGIHWASRSAS